MSFEVALKNLVDRVPHAIGAIMVDWEGEAVMEYCHCDPYDMRFLAAHEGLILARLKEMQSISNVGAIEDVVVSAGKEHILIGCINQDYSLVMNIGRSCPAALGLYHFRQTITELKKEI